jgi:hypothetical protein
MTYLVLVVASGGQVPIGLAAHQVDPVDGARQLQSGAILELICYYNYSIIYNNYYYIGIACTHNNLCMRLIM